MSEVYYRVFLDHLEGDFVVVCLQDFDERDYDQARFLTGGIASEEVAEDIAALANAILSDNLKSKDGLRLLRLIATHR